MTAIKSVFNRGTWDRGNDDISYSIDERTVIGPMLADVRVALKARNHATASNSKVHSVAVRMRSQCSIPWSPYKSSLNWLIASAK